EAGTPKLHRFNSALELGRAGGPERVGQKIRSNRRRSDLAQVADDGLGLGADVEFFVDVLEMTANGVEADGKFAGDFFCHIALGEVIEDFLFAAGELLALRFGGLWLAEGL